MGARLGACEHQRHRMLLMRFCEQLQAAMDKPMSDEVRFICIDGELLDLRSAIVADCGEA